MYFNEKCLTKTKAGIFLPSFFLNSAAFLNKKVIICVSVTEFVLWHVCTMYSIQVIGFYTLYTCTWCIICNNSVTMST